jgi:hypothetical protein
MRAPADAVVLACGVLMIGLAIWLSNESITPIVDGRCTEYTEPPARVLSMESGLVLHVIENQDAIWLCVPLPADSVGMLDLGIDSAALERPLNLHVSAQLGEWPKGGPSPLGPDSPIWWNHRGWTANWQWFHGMSIDGGHPEFAYAPARELQLSKDRFGALPWKLSFTFYQVRGADGTLHNITEGPFVLSATPALRNTVFRR